MMRKAGAVSPRPLLLPITRRGCRSNQDAELIDLDVRLAEVLPLLQQAANDSIVPVVTVPGKNLVMTGPSFSAKIEYRAWTHTCTLRQASFKGLREAEDWTEIYRLPD